VHKVDAAVDTGSVSGNGGALLHVNSGVLMSRN